MCSDWEKQHTQELILLLLTGIGLVCCALSRSIGSFKVARARVRIGNGVRREATCINTVVCRPFS